MSSITHSQNPSFSEVAFPLHPNTMSQLEKSSLIDTKDYPKVISGVKELFFKVVHYREAEVFDKITSCAKAIVTLTLVELSERGYDTALKTKKNSQFQSIYKIELKKGPMSGSHGFENLAKSTSLALLILQFNSLSEINKVRITSKFFRQFVEQPTLSPPALVEVDVLFKEFLKNSKDENLREAYRKKLIEYLARKKALDNLREYAKAIDRKLEFDTEDKCCVAFDNRDCIVITHPPCSKTLFLDTVIFSGLPKDDESKLALYELLLSDKLGNQKLSDGPKVFGIDLQSDNVLSCSGVNIYGASSAVLKSYIPLYRESLAKIRHACSPILKTESNWTLGKDQGKEFTIIAPSREMLEEAARNAYFNVKGLEKEFKLEELPYTSAKPYCCVEVGPDEHIVIQYHHTQMVLYMISPIINIPKNNTSKLMIYEGLLSHVFANQDIGDGIRFNLNNGQIVLESMLRMVHADHHYLSREIWNHIDMLHHSKNLCSGKDEQK